MTKKYRLKNSSTKKYKQTHGGETDVMSKFEQTSRKHVGPNDLEITQEVNRQIKCEDAIKIFDNKYKNNILTTEAQTALVNMNNACYSTLSLDPKNPNYYKQYENNENDGNYESSNESLNPKINSTEKMNLTDEMFILPCLQEREQLNEMEQQGSIIRDEVQTAIPQGNAIYYQFWHGKNQFSQLKDQRTSINVPILLKDRVPNTTNLLSKVPNITNILSNLPTCKSFTTDQKWQMYGEWAKANLSAGGTALLITHHNRLRGLSRVLDFEEGLLPIKNKKQCDSYANNFCFRIHYDPNASSNKITTEIAFQGFPDKGEFGKGCENKIGCNKKTGGGENYIYCCPTKDVTNINTDLLEKGLYNSGITKPTTFYVIRHGNAIHNQPMNIKNGTQLDSPLTPLGLYQAKTLGCFLKENYKEDFYGKDVILGTSFLSRTQLTGLTILNEIKGGGLMNPYVQTQKLNHDYELLKKIALNKFISLKPKVKKSDIKSDINTTNLELSIDRFYVSIFKDFQPVKNDIDRFYGYCCDDLNLLYYIPKTARTSENCKFLKGLNGGKIQKKQTRKNRRQKN